MKQGKRGFTLTEVTIVIAVIGLLALLTIPAITSLNKFSVQVELEQLYQTCLYLQRCAQSTAQKQYLYFDLKNHSYSFKDRVHTLARNVCFATPEGLHGSPALATKVITTPSTFSKNRIVFYPDGIIQPGTIYLADENQKSLYALSSGVAQVSFLRKYHYRNTWFCLN